MFHANYAPILHQDYNYLQTDRNEIPHEPLHQGVPSRVSKIVSLPMVHLAQTVYISCTENNTIPKEAEVRFYMTHVIWEFYWVLPNIFLSIWYVRCNSCTYLTSSLALSPNKANWASTWAPLPWSITGCIQNGFLAYDALGTNYVPILHQN